MPITKVEIQDVFHYYYQVSRKTIVQFLDLFNDIRIARYNSTTNEIYKFVNVPIKFAPKSKHWYWNEKLDENGNRTRDKILPMIAVNLTSVDFDSSRQVSKSNRVKTSIRKDNETIELFYNPVPYNYIFTMEIAAEYMVDITQIIEQIVPFFDSHSFIKITIPELSIGTAKLGSYPLDLKVIYEGGNKDETTSFDESDYRTIRWTLNFKVEGYMMKPKYDYPIIKRQIYEWAIRNDTEKMPFMTTVGLSAEKYPIDDLTTEELSGALYDPELKLLYKYEK